MTLNCTCSATNGRHHGGCEGIGKPRRPKYLQHVPLVPDAALDPMRQVRADLERDAQRREYVAGIESAMLVARWALPVSAAVEAERISRQGTNGLGLDPLAVDGVFLSGDHRPRHGRLYARDVPGE